MGLLLRPPPPLLVLLLLFVSTTAVAVVASATTHVHLRQHHRHHHHDRLFDPDAVPPPPNDGHTMHITGAISDPPPPPPPPQPLPVFFFHGATSNAKAGFHYQRNLTLDGRVFVPLAFCEDACSVTALNSQVANATQHVRTLAATDPRFARGYIFIGHSQGAVIARAVIEAMDDHNVRLFISLAGPHNGVFYGPQPSDVVPTLAFTMRLGPKMISPSLFNFSSYTPLDFASGKFQFDFNAFFFTAPELQRELSVMNLARSPLKAAWRKVNNFLPVVNGVNDCMLWGRQKPTCESDQQRRKANFLRLKSAHFFGSPGDDVVAPWQSTVLGHYADVATPTDLLTNFRLLRVLEMKDTDEFLEDAYGLKSLDARSSLFLYAVPNVSHACWLVDAVPLGKTDKCLFQPLYDQYIYPLLTTHGWGTL